MTPNWELLDRLFAGRPMEFRHRMTLARSDPARFYAPTAEAAVIRAEKETVLQSAAGGLHQIQSPEATVAFDEFLRSTALNSIRPVEQNCGATLLLEPDYLLVAPPDWRIVWASVCFPTRWSLEGKAGMPLAEVHRVVPELDEELGRKIDVFFARLPPGEGWGRANWGLSSNGNRNQHPHLPYTPLCEDTPLDSIFIRVESQHLLKLPATGHIAFGIRIVNFALVEALGHPAIAAGLKEQLRTMPPGVADYKGISCELWRQL